MRVNETVLSTMPVFHCLYDIYNLCEKSHLKWSSEPSILIFSLVVLLLLVYKYMRLHIVHACTFHIDVQIIYCVCLMKEKSKLSLQDGYISQNKEIKLLVSLYSHYLWLL